MLRVENTHFTYPHTYLGEICIEMEKWVEENCTGVVVVLSPNIVCFHEVHDIVPFVEKFWKRPR
jgi:hypothetical protein